MANSARAWGILGGTGGRVPNCSLLIIFSCLATVSKSCIYSPSTPANHPPPMLRLYGNPKKCYLISEEFGFNITKHLIHSPYTIYALSIRHLCLVALH